MLLLAALLGTVRRVVRDAAYSSVAWFALVTEASALPVVRSNPTHPPARPCRPRCLPQATQGRELWAKLKEWRAIATRYDKTVKSFSGGIYLAAAFHWLS